MTNPPIPNPSAPPSPRPRAPRRTPEAIGQAQAHPSPASSEVVQLPNPLRSYMIHPGPPGSELTDSSQQQQQQSQQQQQTNTSSSSSSSSSSFHVYGREELRIHETRPKAKAGADSDNDSDSDSGIDTFELTSLTESQQHKQKRQRQRQRHKRAVSLRESESGRKMLDRLVIPLLVAGMLATGTANTLLTKLQDQVCVGNCSDPDPKKHMFFEQPVVQTLQMFIGEMGCWAVVFGFYLHKRYLDRQRNLAGYEPVGGSDPAHAHVGEGEGSAHVNPAVKALVPNHDDRVRLSGSKVLLLALPACCDIAGTTLMNVGLLFVAASIYQMTRGALVLFVGIFSVIFLKRRLGGYQWGALGIVVSGVAVVGLAGALYKDPSKTVDHADGEAVKKEVSLAVRTVIGVLLIAGAQVFTATQFVLEEFILEKYALEPLRVVGWEGVFGFVVTVVGMFVLHLLVGSTDAGRGGYFDATEGWRQVVEYPMVRKTSIWIMISIGCFNFFGISVTRSISATARSVIDTCRTLFIWMVSLGLGWESFKWLQVVGFGLLVYGTFLFNDLVKEPVRSCWLGQRKGKGVGSSAGTGTPPLGPRLEEAVIDHQ